jgi:hypothetical protein
LGGWSPTDHHDTEHSGLGRRVSPSMFGSGLDEGVSGLQNR